MQGDKIGINVIAELERLPWGFEYSSDDEVKCRCPAHDDKKPSCSVSARTGLWKCHAGGCGAGGDIVKFIALATGEPRNAVWTRLAETYGLSSDKVVDPAKVEAWHERIWSAGPLLKELYARGLNDDMIREYRLGEHLGRVTIPIPNVRGDIVNVRLYLPGAPNHDKFKNLRGFGGMRLFGVESITERTKHVLVLGGEVKRILAAWHLKRKSNVACVSATGGEGNWDPSFTKAIGKRHAYVLMDVDNAGVVATNTIAAQLKATAMSVKGLTLPLDPQAYPHGDVNDWFASKGATTDDLLQLMRASPEWTVPALEEEVEDAEPTEVDLSRSADPDMIGKRVQLTATVSAVDVTPYVVPCVLQCHCTRDQEFCVACPVFAREPDDKGFVTLTVAKTAPGVLEMVRAPKRAQREAIKTALRIPPCKVVQFKPAKYYAVLDARLSAPMQTTMHQSDNALRPAYVIADELEANETYVLKGRTWPSPASQQAVLLAESADPAEDTLSTFQPNEDELDELKLFQADGDIQAKVDELYDDISANVTRIFFRHDVHLAVDMVWHTPLLIPFDGRVEKGWAELLIAGDSAQGKTEVTSRLLQHYGLGARVECKNATVAGLLGGLQKIGDRFFVSWGVIPQNDRRLVVLEEVKGAPTEILARLTDMRSSGVAELPKIEKRRAHARTRLVWVSNPRSNRPLAGYNYGVECVLELIGSLEDVRRFDLVVLVSADQVSADSINRLHRSRPRVPHRHTSKLCRRLVMWAWTRKPDEVAFTDEAASAVIEYATRMCDKFTDRVPLVDKGSMRFKLARLSAGLAARLFSTPDGVVLHVEAKHVKHVADFIDRTYSDPTFGYDDFSRALKSIENLADAELVTQHLLKTPPFPSDFINKLLQTDDVSFTDVADWCGWGREDTMRMISFLVRKNAFMRTDRTYKKTPGFIALLKEIRDSGKAAGADRPVDDSNEDTASDFGL